MRIICPSCEAEYDVPEALLGTAPRPVRCARCATEWIPHGFPAPPPLPIPVEPPAPPEPPSTENAAPSLADEARLPTTRKPARGNRLWPALAWLATIAIIIAAIASAYVWRDSIARAWPPSRQIYSRLGVQTSAE